MIIKLTDGHEFNLTYEELLNIDNGVINFYKKKYPQIFDTAHIMPAFFLNAYGDRLSEIELPESITEIQAQAFENCTNLKSIKLNPGLKIILNHAFKNCDSLTEITIPNSVIAMQNSFYNCTNLRKVVFEPHPVVQEEKKSQITVREAFELEAVIDPKYSNERAFENCPSIEKIDIANIPRINKGAFINCPNIKKIKIIVGDKQNEKTDIILDDDEQFVDIQKEKDSVVIQTKIKDKIISRLVSISKKKMNKFDFDVVLNGEGHAFKNFKFFSDITEEDLKTNKYVAVNGDDFSSIDFVYSDDDVRNIKAKIEEIKKEVLTNSEGLSQKELYARLVTSLSRRLEYDFVGMGVMEGALGNIEKLTHVIDMCQGVTKMPYEKYIISKIGIAPQELFHNMNNVHKVIDTIKNYRHNSRTARALITGSSICYSNPEIIRNIAHELGIDARYYDGLGHSWTQVNLDGVWYDDDFTNYNEKVREGEFDSNAVRLNFLRGYSINDGKRARCFFEDEEHKYRATRSTGEDVGDSVDSDVAKKYLIKAREDLNKNMQQQEPR